MRSFWSGHATIVGRSHQFGSEEASCRRGIAYVVALPRPRELHSRQLVLRGFLQALRPAKKETPPRAVGSPRLHDLHFSGERLLYRLLKYTAQLTGNSVDD